MSKILLITTDMTPVTIDLPLGFKTKQVTIEQDLIAQIHSFEPELILMAPQLLLNFIQNQALVDDNIIVSKTRTGLKRVALSEIQYFEADQKYVLVYYNGGELLLNESLNSLALKYGDKVLRIHRNTLVNTAWIDELINDDDRYYITITGTKTRLSVSRRQLPAVRKYIKCGKSE